MRAWIETPIVREAAWKWYVALRVRAWIETICPYWSKRYTPVALRVRAWIETNFGSVNTLHTYGRPPREGVD